MVSTESVSETTIDYAQALNLAPENSIYNVSNWSLEENTLENKRALRLVQYQAFSPTIGIYRKKIFSVSSSMCIYL